MVKEVNASFLVMTNWRWLLQDSSHRQQLVCDFRHLCNSCGKLEEVAMVVPLKPGKFYGSALPRPRILADVSDGDRLDPPAPVNASFLRWAADASWRMGGVSVQTKRFQGKIEGRLSKLRGMKEDSEPEECAPPKAASSRSLKVRGRFGGKSSKRSSRWKPHKKRSSAKKSPLRLTLGREMIEKHEQQEVEAIVKSKASVSGATHKKGKMEQQASEEQQPARRRSVKRELLVEEEFDETEISNGSVGLRRSQRLRASSWQPSSGPGREQSDEEESDSGSGSDDSSQDDESEDEMDMAARVEEPKSQRRKHSSEGTWSGSDSEASADED